MNLNHIYTDQIADPRCDYLFWLSFSTWVEGNINEVLSKRSWLYIISLEEKCFFLLIQNPHKYHLNIFDSMIDIILLIRFISVKFSLFNLHKMIWIKTYWYWICHSQSGSELSRKQIKVNQKVGMSFTIGWSYSSNERNKLS